MDASLFLAPATCFNCSLKPSCSLSSSLFSPPIHVPSYTDTFLMSACTKYYFVISKNRISGVKRNPKENITFCPHNLTLNITAHKGEIIQRLLFSISGQLLLPSPCFTTFPNRPYHFRKSFPELLFPDNISFFIRI